MAPKYISLGLAALTAAVFLPATSVGFLYLDDHDNIAFNPYVQQGLTWRGVSWALTTFRGEIWNPLMWLSYMADFQLYGLDPAGYHATSLLLHAAATAALFEALRRMTGRPWESAFAAALFGLHPTRVESVAWIAQRYDVLYGLFAFATLAAYAAYVRRPGPLRYGALLGAFALALMSKGLAVTVPALLLVVDYWPLGRLSRKTAAARVREKLPLFAMAAAVALLVLLARRSLLASGPESSVWTRLTAVPVYYLAYLRNVLAPWALPVCHQVGTELSAGLRAACAVGFAATTWLAWTFRARAPYVWAGWLWFLLALSPVIGLAFPAGMTVRYTYLPLVGLALAASWGGAALLRKAGAGAKGAVLAALIVVASASYLTRRELGFWADQRVLFERWLQIAPGNRLLHNILGVLLAQRGDFVSAEANLREAIRLAPGYVEAHNNLGKLLSLAGRPREAAEEYRRALEINPGYERARRNLERLSPYLR